MKVLRITAMAALLTVVAFAQQASPISLDVLSKKVVAVTADDGSKTEKLEAITKVLPGEIVQYELVCKNNGSEPAERVVIGNPLPANMLYIPGSATTEGAALRFSADGGGVYSAFEELKVNDPNVGERPARIEEITHIQWTFEEPLKPGSAKVVVYRTRLK